MAGAISNAMQAFSAQADPTSGGGGRDLTGTDAKFLMRAGKAGDLSQFAPGTPDYEAKYASERSAYEDRHSQGKVLGALGIAAPFVLPALGVGAGAAAGGSSMMPAAVPAVDATFGGALTQVSPGVFAAGGVGAAGAEAMGLAGGAAGGGEVGSGYAASAPGPAASAGAPLGAPAAATPSGAGGATGAGSTAPAATEMSFTDSLIKQMKDNALGLGLVGAGMIASNNQTTPMPNQAALQGLGAEAAATAQQLMAQHRSGNLSPGQQASLDQLTQNTKNQLRQYFAGSGQADSTAAAQAMAQVDQAALAMKQQMLDTALQQGLQAIGIAQGPLNTIAQYQLGQDAQLKQAFGNFAGGMGTLFGRNAGTQQKPQGPVSSAQQTPVVQSTQSPQMP